MNTGKIWLALAVIVTVSGCVTTKTLSPKQVGDQDLSCDSLATRIGEVRAAREYAIAKRGASTENVAALILFWPALVTNNSNTNEMISSMDAREIELTTLYNDKKCASPIPQYDNKEIAEKLKSGNTEEAFR